VEQKLGITNQRMERMEVRLDDTNKKLDTVVSAVSRLPGVKRPP
jgi:hypothetical protein